ncbi:MAG: SDR family oxidoreductase [Lautropia sp.]|nr:SDR family oxidoreductase [Lautropia sp.]
MQSFANKTIVITGASDGIGAEIARQLAPESPRLVLAARTEDKLNEVAFRCRKAGADILVVPTDVGEQQQCQRLIAQAEERFGSIDVLINNAGITMQARFDQISDLATFEKLMRVNFFGSMWCTHAALPALTRSRGLVVGVSSLAGKTGVPERTTYCASKFAMSGFFEALRMELAETGVDVTMVFPGMVGTALRRNGFNGSGERAGLSKWDESAAMSVERCAALAIEGMRVRRRDVIMTGKGRLGLKLKAFAPQLIDRLTLKALTKNPGQ